MIKKSLFYLLYKIHSRIFTDKNDFLKINKVTNAREHIKKINYIRILINELLFNRTININKIKNIKVIKISFKKNN
jgi:hypothetical protein